MGPPELLCSRLYRRDRHIRRCERGLGEMGFRISGVSMAKCLWGKDGSEWAYEWPIVGGREFFSRLNMIRKCIFGSFERRNEGKSGRRGISGTISTGVTYAKHVISLPIYFRWQLSRAAGSARKKRNSPIKIHIDHKLRGNIVVGLELDSSLGCRGDSGVVYRLPVPYDKLTNRTRTLVLFLFTTDTQPCFKRTAGKTWTGPNHDESLLYVIPP